MKKYYHIILFYLVLAMFIILIASDKQLMNSLHQWASTTGMKALIWVIAPLALIFVSINMLAWKDDVHKL